MSEPFFTIGHSTRPLTLFIGLLQQADVRLLADVRTVPGSRRNPQYARSRLAHELAEHRIGYTHIAALGGLRGKSRDIPPEVNAYWNNESFHNYADYAMTEPFQLGLGVLRELGQRQRCAIMCAEALWWRCHRRIIADYLLAAGETVFHILGKGEIAEASLTPTAKIGKTGIVTYPAMDDRHSAP